MIGSNGGNGGGAATVLQTDDLGGELTLVVMYQKLNARIDAVVRSQADLAPRVEAALRSLATINAGLDAAKGSLDTMTAGLAAVQNPTTGLAIDALRLIDHLNATSAAYQNAILVEVDLRRAAKDAKDSLARLENGMMADLITMADAGAGPLAGIAKTSKAWQTVLDAAMEKARSEPTLKPVVQAARKAELAADEARAHLQVNAEAFSAAKHASDLMCAILGAIK